MDLITLWIAARDLGGWFMTERGQLRRRPTDGLYLWECPITAVANTHARHHQWSEGSFQEAGEFLGLSISAIRLTALLADNRAPNPALL